MAIGARSQSAKTYLERHVDAFLATDLSQLIAHAMKALQDCLPNETELNTRNCTVCVVGVNTPFVSYEDEKMEPFIAALASEAAPMQASAAVLATA